MPIEDIIVIDDFITPSYQLGIKNIVFSIHYPWHYEPATAFPNKNKPIDMFVDGQTQESHQLVNALFNGYENTRASNFDFFLPVVMQAQDIIQEPTKLIRLKTNLLLRDKVYPEKFHHTAHVDTREPHWVMIYYIQDSDGDTVIFDQTFGTDFDQLTVKKRIQPRQGRAVIFNGKYFHTSVSPTLNETRTVINCTLETIKQGGVNQSE